MWEDGTANLDIHEVIHADASKFRELLSALLQELGNGVALLTLDMVETSELASFGLLYDTHHNTLSVTASIPIGIRHFDVFILEFLLFLQPLLTQLFTFLSLRLLSFSIRQERCIDSGVLSQLWPLGRFPILVHSRAGCG